MAQRAYAFPPDARAAYEENRADPVPELAAQQANEYGLDVVVRETGGQARLDFPEVDRVPVVARAGDGGRDYRPGRLAELAFVGDRAESARRGGEGDGDDCLRRKGQVAGDLCQGLIR